MHLPMGVDPLDGVQGNGQVPGEKPDGRKRQNSESVVVERLSVGYPSPFIEVR